MVKAANQIVRTAYWVFIIGAPPILFFKEAT